MRQSAPARLFHGFLLISALAMVPGAGFARVAEPAKPPFTAVIALENPDSVTGQDAYTIKAGSKVFIRVRLTNISRRKLSLGYDKDSRTNIDFFNEYEVRDMNGNLIPKRPIDQIGSTAHGWPERVLKPGESMEITGDFLSRLFDLSQLDTYTVQLTRRVSGDPKDGVVKSNTITVVVTR